MVLKVPLSRKSRACNLKIIHTPCVVSSFMWELFSYIDQKSISLWRKSCVTVSRVICTGSKRPVNQSDGNSRFQQSFYSHLWDCGLLTFRPWIVLLVNMSEIQGWSQTWSRALANLWKYLSHSEVPEGQRAWRYISSSAWLVLFSN